MKPHFKIVITGRDCMDRLPACVESVERQSYRDFEVYLADDCSEDENQHRFVRGWVANRPGWNGWVSPKRMGALHNQYTGITFMVPKDDDVVVFLDADDRLGADDALEMVAETYDTLSDILLTYGGYRSEPYSSTCHVPDRYPIECERKNEYRNAYKWGVHYGHLRTVKFKLFRHLDPAVDLTHRGRWHTSTADTAVMIPCLEMAAGRYHVFGPEADLYVYSSDGESAEWRINRDNIEQEHAYIFTKVPKKQALA